MFLLALVITLEHATTPETQAHGLMYRKALPENHGMAFSFAESKRRAFWSKNCIIDLDVAFLNKDHVIQEICRLRAQPTEEVFSTKPTQYVVEMNAGFFEKNDVHVGDKIIWETSAFYGSIIPHVKASYGRSQSASRHLSQ